MDFNEFESKMDNGKIKKRGIRLWITQILKKKWKNV